MPIFWYKNSVRTIALHSIQLCGIISNPIITIMETIKRPTNVASLFRVFHTSAVVVGQSTGLTAMSAITGLLRFDILKKATYKTGYALVRKADVIQAESYNLREDVARHKAWKEAKKEQKALIKKMEKAKDTADEYREMAKKAQKEAADAKVTLKTSKSDTEQDKAQKRMERATADAKKYYAKEEVARAEVVTLEMDARDIDTDDFMSHVFSSDEGHYEDSYIDLDDGVESEKPSEATAKDRFIEKLDEMMSYVGSEDFEVGSDKFDGLVLSLETTSKDLTYNGVRKIVEEKAKNFTKDSKQREVLDSLIGIDVVEDVSDEPKRGEKGKFKSPEASIDDALEDDKSTKGKKSRKKAMKEEKV